MRPLHLTEYLTEPAVLLTVEERDALRSFLSVEPTPGATDHFDLTPGSTVGAVEVGSLSVEISPKLPISQVMFLISYALDPTAWRDTGFDFGEEESLVEAVVPGFVAQVGRAFRRGILQGYRTEEEALSTVRGRIRFDDQIRRRYGIAPPIEVRYDEFTEDIDINRLIKAAIGRLGRMRLRSGNSRSQLRAFDGALARVGTVDFHPDRLPEVAWSRLNEHYRPAVRLAKLILRSSAFELRGGEVRSSAFLVDMNRVFEDFVVTALREALGLSDRSFPQGNSDLRLDRAGAVRLEPDISWWEGGRCVFVGDVKYKKVNVGGIRHPDLYQLLAYMVASDLPTGLLIYAAGEEAETVHEIVNVGRRLEVVTLDLAGSPEDVLGQIRDVADRIRMMRNGARQQWVA